MESFYLGTKDKSIDTEIMRIYTELCKCRSNAPKNLI